MQVEAIQLQQAQAGATPVDTSLGNGEERSFDELARSIDLHKAIRSQIPGQGVSLDGAESEVHEELSKRALAAGVSVSGLVLPMGLQSRADQQTVTQDGGAFGGNTVQTNLSRNPIEFLEPTPILQSLGATVLNGLTGNVEFIKDDGGISASWEGEITEGSDSKEAYGKIGMTPKRLNSNVGISLLNLLQSNFDLQMHTVNRINKVVALKLDAAGINGSGVGNVPLGILNDSGVNTIAVGTNGGAPTWDHIVDLENLVDVANYMGVDFRYLINSKTKGKLKKTKHQAGDLNYLMNSRNEINGYQVGISNQVPGDLIKGTGSDLSAAIFGDFSKMMIGNWGFMDLVVDNITRKKEAIVELSLNSFHDILLQQPKAFTVVKDWDTQA